MRARRSWTACLLACGISWAWASTEDGEGGRLTVRVSGLRSAEGQVAIALFDSAVAFESRTDPVRAAFLPLHTVADGCTWVVDGLPDGEYAVMLYHDRNRNRRLDKKPFGMPSEPYGFSNDARAPFGPPSFEAARFDLRGDRVIDIEAR